MLRILTNTRTLGESEAQISLVPVVTEQQPPSWGGGLLVAEVIERVISIWRNHQFCRSASVCSLIPLLSEVSFAAQHVQHAWCLGFISSFRQRSQKACGVTEKANIHSAIQIFRNYLFKAKMLLIAVNMKLDYWQLNFPLSSICIN